MGSVQGDCGRVEQFAGSADSGCCGGAGRSSVHAVVVEEAGSGGGIVARASKLDVETTAELRRLRELERRYKVLKEEHEI